MKTIIMLAPLCALVAASVFAGDEITVEKYPDADTVLVDDIEKVKYNPDGTYVQTEESWTKIMTEKGRRGQSSYTLDYSKRYGTAEIEFVKAIGTNGVERTIDVSATTSEQTDNSSMSVNIYDPLDRVIVCTIPGLQIGETVHLKVRRTALEPRCEGVWSDISMLESTEPMVHAVYEITAPAARPLKRLAIRHGLGNVVSSARTNEDGSVVHTFVATNSPQAFPEPDMPALYTQIQHVRVSTASDWKEISRWYDRLCAPHLAKTNAAMVAKVKELAKGGGDAALRAIFKFVSQEVRYMGLTMEDTSPGYAPHDVDITFNNRYGVCRDKAALLVAMLRLAGFKAFPVLINVGPKQDPEIPLPYFNHAIVGVETSSTPSYILLDPTNENANEFLPAYESDLSYLVARPEGENLLTTPTPSPDHNRLAVESKGSLSKDGSLFLESDIRFDGINDTLYRGAFVKKTNEDRVKFFERLVKALSPSARLVHCEIEPRDMRETEKPVRVRLGVEMPEMTIKGETCDELSVPFLSKRMGIANFLLQGSTSLEKRRFPLKVESTACVDEDVTIEVDEAWQQALSLPQDLVLTNGYEFARAFTFTNGTLRAHRRMAVARLTFDPDAYLRLRGDIQAVEAAERQRPILLKDAYAESDIHTCELATTVDILSDREWTVTNHAVREILTYQGKKSSAEVKIGYNPCVERIGILSATVSNRNGKVSAISSREINVMDCGWAASAPRYPASKLIVVNLPGVEIGSVTDVTIVRVVTNAPTAYYGVFRFDSQDPVENYSVRVGDFSRTEKTLKRIPKEPSQPDARLWRDVTVFSPPDFVEAAQSLKEAYAGVDDLDRDVADAIVNEAEAASQPQERSKTQRIRTLRDWMAQHIKLAGPGLWEMPINLQLTPPDVVLTERYATRLDYIRTLTALLRAEGFKADIVFATNDAGDLESLRRLAYERNPNVRAFSSALCRVTVTEGGFLGLGGETKTYFIGTENEYAPLGICGFTDSTYYDPLEESFDRVTVPDETYRDNVCEKTEIVLRENGSADLTDEVDLYGQDTASFRKRYAEILPEERSRRYQAILGDIAQAATATSELVTDVTSYPAKRRFSCFIPDYATIEADTMTIQLPSFESVFPTFTGRTRETPFRVGSARPATEEVVVKFPEGYTKIEHLPESFEFPDPADPGKVWQTSCVSAKVVDGHLEVTIRRECREHDATWYTPDYIELVKDRSRIAAARANRTIVVRK